MLIDLIGERADQGITSLAFMIILKDAELTMRQFATDVLRYV